jgi:hypothetical protein
MGERGEPLSEVANKKRKIPSTRVHTLPMSRLMSVSVIARQWRRCTPTGRFWGMIGPLMEMATAHWSARRVEGNDHEAAHDVGAGEPLVGQWRDG